MISISSVNVIVCTAVFFFFTVFFLGGRNRERSDPGRPVVVSADGLPRKSGNLKSILGAKFRFYRGRSISVFFSTTERETRIYFFVFFFTLWSLDNATGSL